MLQLDNIKLDPQEQTSLDALQNAVNAEPDFTAQVAKAKALWKSKPATTFSPLRSTLLKMCVGVEVCNYCEGNEANDIEHIYPKAFFPDKAFVWDNYLLACKQCNSAYKLDRCYVLDLQGNVHPASRNQVPQYTDIAMINPRVEDPNDFLWLNTQVWTFEVKDHLAPRNHNKAKKTIEILALNERDYLRKAREQAADYYYNIMHRLALIYQATDIQSIRDALSPAQDEIMSTLDAFLNLDQIKGVFKDRVRADLVTYSHPSVWYAIRKVASKTSPKWQFIFQVVPEALNWA